jgi:hypothetical protein
MWWATLGLAIVAACTLTAIVLVERANRARKAAEDRNRELEARLADRTEIEAAIVRARNRPPRHKGDRDGRPPLRLVALIPLAWLTRSSYARAAAAAGVSAVVIGAGFTAPDSPVHPMKPTAPAAAESLGNPAVVDTPVRARGVPPSPLVPPATTTTTTMITAEVVARPPAASAVVEPGPTPSGAPTAMVPDPSTTTTLPTDTTTTTTVEVPRPCRNQVPTVTVPLCAS